MSFQRVTILLSLLLAARVSANEDLIDRLGQTLTAHTPDGHSAARLSGTLDVETYFFPQPAPGLIYTTDDTLTNPRLSLFLDAQLGAWCYFFTQARVDRGFDPSDRDLEARFDEIAVRVGLR